MAIENIIITTDEATQVNHCFLDSNKPMMQIITDRNNETGGPRVATWYRSLIHGSLYRSNHARQLRNSRQWIDFQRVLKRSIMGSRQFMEMVNELQAVFWQFDWFFCWSTLQKGDTQWDSQGEQEQPGAKNQTSQQPHIGSVFANDLHQANFTKGYRILTISN